MKKGQYIRLLIGEAANALTVIGAAKEMTLHVSSAIEESSTKDTTGDYQEQEVTGLSYDISSQQLVLEEDDTLESNGVNTLETLFLAGTRIYWKIANVSGTNNRTVGDSIASGTGYIQQLTINAQNKQNATAQISITGYGEMTIG